VPKSLVGTHCVIGVLPSSELLVQRGYLQGKVIHFIELFSMGTLGTLYGTVEPGKARRQYEEAKASLLACLLEPCLELGASIHLYGSYRKGHPGLEDAQKARGSVESRGELY